jgi:2',3'-cyclic-nucleotide 2'-phosphodiesterase
MKIAFIGDIVGRPGRKIIKDNLKKLKDEYSIDYIIANGENASHGFGLTVKNCDELLKSGINIITGGNHSFDKKGDMIKLLSTNSVLRPYNYAQGVPGKGIYIHNIEDEKIAIINLMGIYGMPIVDNPFNMIEKIVDDLKSQGVNNIFIDFHAQATSEKRVLAKLLEGKVSAICGTHTHVGTDDLQICDGTFYLTDIGLTGCRDNIIGMDKKVPIEKLKTGIGSHFDVPNSCKSILQLAIIDIQNGRSIDGFKIKIFNDREDRIISKAIIE